MIQNSKFASNRQGKFGQWLKFQRDYAKLTQRELADKLDVTPAYISKMENAKTEVQPSLCVLNKMASVFNLLPIAVMNNAGVIDRDKLQSLLDNKPGRAYTLNCLIEKWEAEDNG